MKRIVLRALVSLCSFLWSSAVFAEEIAMLAVKRDITKQTTTSELLPIAKVDHGTFKAISGVERADTEACTHVDFAGWENAGTSYEVLYRGEVIGNSITASKQEHGIYGNCIVTAATKLNAGAPHLKPWIRKGDFGNGYIEESVTQYVAYTKEEGQRIYSTRIAAPITKSERESLEAYAKSKLIQKNQKQSSHAHVLLSSVETFLGSKDGEINISFVAEMKQPSGDRIRGISSIVRRGKDGAFESLFESIADGYEDRGFPNYTIVDAADFDGDGMTELLAIYNDYEFNEFQILKRVNSKFEVVLKAASYGE